MVTTNLVFGSSDNQNASTTGYPPLVADGLYSGSGIPYTEALIYDFLFENATFGNLWAFISTISLTGSSTLTLRKNSSNTSLAVSAPPFSSGTYADNVDTATGTGGDGFNYAWVAGTGSGGTNGSVYSASVSMTSAHLTSWMNGEIPGAALVHPLNFNTGLVYGLAGGAGDWATTESQVQYTVRTPLHAFWMYAYVTNNTLNGSTTFSMRKNGAPGNMNVSIGASGTGAFTDAVDTDDFGYGDKTSYGFTPSGSSGSLDTASCAVTCYGSDNVGLFTGINGFAQASLFLPGPNNFDIAGDGFTQNGTGHGLGQLLIRSSPVRLVYLALNSTYHSGSGTLNVFSQKNGANASLALSVSSTSSGYFEDTVDSDSLLPGDLINLATSGTGNPQNNYWISPTAMMQYPPSSTPSYVGATETGSRPFVID